MRPVWRARISVAFAVLFAGPLAHAGPSAPEPLYLLSGVHADAGYAYDSNVSQASGASKLADQIYSINLSKAWELPVSEHTRALSTLFGSGDGYHSWRGLSRLSGGGAAEFQYRTSGDFSAPTFSLFARFTGDQYESRMRDGHRYSAGLSASKPVTDRINVFGAIAHGERTGASSVFSGRYNSARFNIDYSVTSTSTLYFSGEYRRGDAVSSATPGLASLDIAKVIAPDDVFRDRGFTDYRFEAKTALATLGYNLPLSNKDSLDFSWRRVQSTSVDSPSFTGRQRYTGDQFSLNYLVRF
jgi:hypothetical protein